MNLKRIYIDMDGVLVDFVGGVLDLFNRDEEETLAKWPPGEYDIAKVLGVEEEKFWERINSQGLIFWVNLKPYSWATELLATIAVIAPITIVTQPTRHSSSARGKMTWLIDFFGHEFHDFVITPHKELLAQDGMLLIDDSDVNCRAFINASKYAFALRWPQPWNHNAEKVGDRTKHLHESLEAIKLYRSLENMGLSRANE